MKYRSTRSGETVSGAATLLRGLAADGGLYVPEALPAPFLDFEEIKNFSYEELAVYVLSRFFTEIPEAELTDFVRKAYATFETKEVVPVRAVGAAFSVAEMYHGRTCAFKDLALSLFPYILTWAKAHENEKRRVLILTATSGDTGKAALEGFRDVPGTNIFVFYPAHGVSPLQQDQMQKQEGANVRIRGIEGNFDDAQTAVKKIFSAGLTPEEGGDAVVFSSANSINIGRLFPQVVYYVWMWLSLVRDGRISEGEAFNVVVPTGNFGNILAAWIAKQIGAPISRLVCASNDNHILTDFFTTGAYDTHRDFHLTASPSMDILVSSNFERFLYYMTGEAETAAAMKALSAEGQYQVSKETLSRFDGEMLGGWADGAAMEAALRDMYENYDYLIDPHTAVACAVYDAMRRRGKLPRGTHTVIASTAHPYKFPDAVAGALGISVSGTAYEKLRTIEKETGTALPPQLSRLENAPVRFPKTIPREDMAEAVKAYVKEIS